MKVHELKGTAPKSRKRLGRGIGSGYGKTAGRGTKGQNARTGGGVRPGFEGGQNPLAKRLPKKRGFVALNHTSYQVVNLSQLSAFPAGTKINNSTLHQAGLVKSLDRPVKILGAQEVKAKFSLAIQAISRSAAAVIAQSGGSVEIVGLKNSVTKAPSPKSRRVKSAPPKETKQ